MEPQKKPNLILLEIKDWIKSITSALVIILIIFAIISPVRVNGDSMLPNLTDGDRLIVNKLAYKYSSPKYGDIIIFTKADGELLIKRIIGLPGDHIELKDGFVYRNGTKLDEPYINEETFGTTNTVVEEEHLFVMGDNRNDSIDSRLPMVGQVPISQVKGKTIVRLLPNFQIFK